MTKTQCPASIVPRQPQMWSISGMFTKTDTTCNVLSMDNLNKISKNSEHMVKRVNKTR